MPKATIDHVLEAVQDLSTHMDQEFSVVKSDISLMKGDIVGMKCKATSFEEGLVATKQEILTEIDHFVVLP